MKKKVKSVIYNESSYKNLVLFHDSASIHEIIINEEDEYKELDSSNEGNHE